MEHDQIACVARTQPIVSRTSGRKSNSLVIVKPMSDRAIAIPSNYQAAALALTETCLNDSDATKENTQNGSENSIVSVEKLAVVEKLSAQEGREGNLGSTVLENQGAISSEDLNSSIETTRSSCSLKLYRTKAKERQQGRLQGRQRSDSLPLCFANLSVADLTLPVYINSHAPRSDGSVTSDAPILEEGVSKASATPPPTYRSLIKQTLADIPPSYESVTGLSLNIAQDPSNVTGKSNSRNSRSSTTSPQSKIIIVIIISIVILTTLILVLAEAFTSM